MILAQLMWLNLVQFQVIFNFNLYSTLRAKITFKLTSLNSCSTANFSINLFLFFIKFIRIFKCFFCQLSSQCLKLAEFFIKPLFQLKVTSKGKMIAFQNVKWNSLNSGNLKVLCYLQILKPSSIISKNHYEDFEMEWRFVV